MTRDTQDSLQNFVKGHKEEFDTLTPNDKIWESIHKELEQSNRANSKIIFWRVAAIILFVCSVGLIFYANKELIWETSPSIAYDSEFVDTEKYYRSVINERQQLITLVAESHPEIESDFEADWEILDQSYLKLKEEYSKSQSKEVRNALVQNLRSRVNLLNRQIEILESIDSDKSRILEI